MEWVKERDLLIAQTLAFVQSVNDRKVGARRLDAKRWAESRIEAAPIDATKPIDVVKIDVVKIVEPPANIPFSVPAARLSVPAARPTVSGDVRAEIQNRVASFRAHQQRFHRERDEYCSATLAKMRVLVSDGSASIPLRE
jgi:hypothetical protein